MTNVGHRLIGRVGLVLMLGGAALLFTAAPASAQAAGHRLHHGGRAPVAAPTCGKQYGLNDPTNSANKVLTSYSFTIEHAGVTTDVCSLFPNVRAGDVVTAHFAVNPAATQALRLSLVSYTATDDSSTQTLFDCASFGVATGSCAATSSSALTVAVPACGFQIDLIYGAPLQTITAGDYHHVSHVWISGQLGDVRSESTCSASSTPTPTPRTTPTSNSGGSGVLGISTPSTGSGTGTSLQTALGFLLLATGAGAVIFAGHRLRTGTAIPTP
jgi:hypothetical protein